VEVGRDHRDWSRAGTAPVPGIDAVINATKLNLRKIVRT